MDIKFNWGEDSVNIKKNNELKIDLNVESIKL
jgi:hypothetical protein